MIISYSQRALREISSIYDYLAAENRAAADRVLDRIDAIAAFVGEYPSAGHAVGLRDIRVIPVHPYPYLVFFRSVIGRQEVRILRVRHAARRPLYVHEPVREFTR